MLRQLSIRPVLNGFVVMVGCQEVVFTSRETLTASLADYLVHPDETEARWCAESLNAKQTLDGAMLTPPTVAYAREQASLPNFAHTGTRTAMGTNR